MINNDHELGTIPDDLLHQDLFASVFWLICAYAKPSTTISYLQETTIEIYKLITRSTSFQGKDS